MLNTSVNLSEIIIQTEDTSLASQINICILFSKAKALLFVPLSLKLSLSCSLSFVGEKNYTQSNNSNSKVAGPAVNKPRVLSCFGYFFHNTPNVSMHISPCYTVTQPVSITFCSHAKFYLSSADIISVFIAWFTDSPQNHLNSVRLARNAMRKLWRKSQNARLSSGSSLQYIFILLCVCVCVASAPGTGGRDDFTAGMF